MGSEMPKWTKGILVELQAWENIFLTKVTRDQTLQKQEARIL